MDYIHSNGFSYTQEEIEQAAKKRNISVQDYLDKTPELKPGKAQGSTVDPTMGQNDMGSQSVDGLSESQEELSDQEQFSNVFFNAGLGLQEAWESTKIAGAQFGNYIGIGDDEKVDDYIEIGPGKVLLGMVKRTLKNINCFSINSIDDIKKLVK